VHIELAKKSDGSVILRCVRGDGTATWQRHEGRNAQFFPWHDLTHFAVETVLKHRRGFYGLVAEGWDLTDFGTPWPRGPLPADAEPAELIVGLFDLERATGVRVTAEQIRAHVSALAPSAEFDLSDAELERIRKAKSELFERWSAVPAGSTLKLEFKLPAPHPAAEETGAAPDPRA
jgi:hypothetical protein